MLNWYKKLYVGANIKGKQKKYIRRIQRKKLVGNIYLLTIAANGVDQVDIISANMLLQSPLRNSCPLIIGIAKGYEEAIELLIELVMKVQKEKGNLDLKAYIYNT